MTLRIYGALRSRATRPVWMAKELGLPYEHVKVLQAGRVADPLAAGAPLNTHSPAYRAINPLGQVPAIEDDGLVLGESLAITLYLARRHGGSLAPRDMSEEGQVLSWTLWAATECESHALRALQNVPSVKTRDVAVYDAAVAALRPKIAMLEAGLEAGGGHLVGKRFTVADLNVAEVFRYAQGAPELFADCPKVTAWLATCQARPAFKEMMAERNAEPA